MAHAVYICHLEQARTSEASESASKDPEDVSPAMPIRGVLPDRLCYSFPRSRRIPLQVDPSVLQFWQLPDFGNSGNLPRIPAGRTWPKTGAAKCGFRDSPSVELPESAWWCAHPRDLSTRPQSLRSLVLAQDDTLLCVISPTLCVSVKLTRRRDSK